MCPLVAVLHCIFHFCNHKASTETSLCTYYLGPGKHLLLSHSVTMLLWHDTGALLTWPSHWLIVTPAAFREVVPQPTFVATSTLTPSVWSAASTLTPGSITSMPKPYCLYMKTHFNPNLVTLKTSSRDR